MTTFAPLLAQALIGFGTFAKMAGVAIVIGFLRGIYLAVRESAEQAKRPKRYDVRLGGTITERK